MDNAVRRDTARRGGGGRGACLPGDNDGDVLALLLADRVRPYVGVDLLLRVVPDGAGVQHEDAGLRPVVRPLNPAVSETFQNVSNKRVQVL